MAEEWITHDDGDVWEDDTDVEEKEEEEDDEVFDSGRMSEIVERDRV